MTNACIFSLRPRSKVGIYAVPYRDHHRLRPLRLPDGAIVETPLPDQRSAAPERFDDCFEIAVGGTPATIHHANLGLITGFLPFEGVYLLPNGDVAAVYGAEAIPIG